MGEGPPTVRVGLDGSVLRQFNTGTEEFIESLVRGLYRIGVNLCGIGCAKPLEPDQERLGQPLREKRPPWAKWRWETAGLVSEAAAAGVNVLHIPYMAHPPGALALPTVVNVHDVIPYRFPAYQRRFRDRQYFKALRGRLQFATRLVAVSRATADDFAVVFPHLTDRLEVIPIGPDEAYHALPTAEGAAELAAVVPAS
ncbi:MAG: glycosyltransferase, partial [Clostridia bacterium]